MVNRLLCVVFAFMFALASWAEDIQAVMNYYKPDMTHGFIFISKADMTLTLVNSQGRTVVTYPMACGRNRGQKRSRGDNRTPEGHFLLQNIQDASSWGHDFHDGKGFIKHAYGPWFMRLQTGFQGIGIHGTHAPESIGTRASEGCIRLENNNVAALQSRVTIGMPVIIGPEDGVQSLIAANIPSPRVAGAKGLSGQHAGRPAQRPTSPAQHPTQSVAAAPAATPSVVVRNDGQLDVAPETDVEIIMPNGVVSQPAVIQPQQVVSVAEPAEPIGKPAPSSLAQPEVLANPIVAVDAETPALDANNNAEEPAKHENELAAASQNENETAQAAGLDTSDAEPRYEVVVEEVVGPDGEVRYEVRYKPVK